MLPQIPSLNYNLIKESLDYWIYYSYGKVRSYAQPYVSTHFSANKVIDNLYIGDFASACNREELQKLGITHVLTVVSGIGPIYPETFKYKNIDIGDTKSSCLNEHFSECVEFIDEAISNGGKVYVHCMCGISRSATIVASYLIKKHKYCDQSAIDLIKMQRDCINPNEGFRLQLKSYYQLNKSD